MVEIFPPLHLSDVRAVVENVGGSGGAERMHTEPLHFLGKPDLLSGKI